MSKTRFLALIVLVAWVAGCRTPAFIKQSDLDTMGLEIAWHIPANKARRLREIYLFKNAVIERDTSNVLYAFARDSGTTQWVRRLHDRIVGDLSENQRFLYVVTYSHVYEMDQLSGYGEKKYKLKFVPISGPAVNNKHIFITSLDNKVHGVAKLDGRHMWEKTARKPLRIDRPTIGEGQIFFASDDESIYAVTEADGKKTWRFMTEGLVQGPMQYRDGIIYLTTFQGNIMAITRFDRKEWSRKVIWEYQLDRTISEGAQLGDTMLFVIDSKNSLWVFDLVPAKKAQQEAFEGPRWSQTGAQRVAGVGSKYLYVTTPGQKLKKLDIQNGKVMAEMPLPGLQMAAINARTPEIYVADGEGNLFALKEKKP